MIKAVRSNIDVMIRDTSKAHIFKGGEMVKFLGSYFHYPRTPLFSDIPFTKLQAKYLRSNAFLRSRNLHYREL